MVRGLERRAIIQVVLILVLFAALAYGVIAPRGNARAMGLLTPTVPGTPGAFGTPSSTRAIVPTLTATATASVTPRATTTGTARATASASSPISTARPAANSTPGTPHLPGATLAASPTPLAAGGTPGMTITPTLTPTRATSAALSASVISGLSPLSFTLNGRNQVASATMVLGVSGAALPEQQAGWQLTMTMEQFQVAGMPSRVLPRNAVSLVAVTVACAQGATCSVPQNTLGYPLDLPAGEAVMIYAAAPGSGSGAFVLTLTFAVRVPGDARAGSYGTSINVNIVGAPVPLASLPSSVPTTPTVTSPSPTSTVPSPTAVASLPSSLAFPATDAIGTTLAVNLRTTPDATSPTQGLLPRGTLLQATGETRVIAGILWRRFALPDGRQGWVRDSDVVPIVP